MKQQRSIDEALVAAKELRKKSYSGQPTLQSEADSHLKVVAGSPSAIKGQASTTSSSKEPSSTEQDHQVPKTTISNPKPIWVRHTIGLRDTTSLSLRDAADGQKRKERHGQLQPGEPANEQEIADLGIALALKQLGYLN